MDYREILQDMMVFSYGVYGWAIVFSILGIIVYGIERLVKWVGDKISKYRKAKTLCK